MPYDYFSIQIWHECVQRQHCRAVGNSLVSGLTVNFCVKLTVLCLLLVAVV